MDQRPQAESKDNEAKYFGVYFFRKFIRSGVIWGLVFFGFVSTSALSYLGIYASPAQREALVRAFGSNLATIALFGPAPSLNTTMGFTQFKSLLSVSIIGALWGYLTTTKAIKGEEEAQRWDLVISTPTTLRRTSWSVFKAVLFGILAIWITMGVSLGLLTLDSKLSMSLSMAFYLATASIVEPIVFASFALFASQFSATRRQASSWCGWLLAAGYLARMLADSKVGVAWLIWLSPLGWVEKLSPLTAPKPAALLPPLLFSVAMVTISLYLSGIRDVGRGLITSGDRRGKGLGERRIGHLGLTRRLFGPFVVAWLLAVAFCGFAASMVAEGAGSTMAGSSIEGVFSRLGARGADARGFLGFASLILALIIEAFSASLAKETSEEETSLRIEQFLTRSYRGTRWIWERFAIYVVALAFASLAAGFAMYLGSTIGGSQVPIAALLGAGINLLPGGIVIQGFAMAGFGLAGDWATKAAYSVLGWSILLELFDGIRPINHWLMDTSILHQMSPAPASPIDWTSAMVLVLLSLGLVALGSIGFASRDIGAQFHPTIWVNLRGKVGRLAPKTL